MANTGYKGFSNLEEYYVDDNSLTGITKTNACYLPEYIAPIYDTVGCPVVNTSISLDQYHLVVAANSDTFDVTITSNYDELNFSSDVGWIGITPTGYSGNLILALYMEMNWDGYTRYATVYIYHGTTYVTCIIIEQMA